MNEYTDPSEPRVNEVLTIPAGRRLLYKRDLEVDYPLHQDYWKSVVNDLLNENEAMRAELIRLHAVYTGDIKIVEAMDNITKDKV